MVLPSGDTRGARIYIVAKTMGDAVKAAGDPIANVQIVAEGVKFG